MLTVIPFSDKEEAIRLANDTDYGLEAAVWSSNLAEAQAVAQKLRVGTVWINTFDVSDITTPFGEFKLSGHSRDRSIHAIENYSLLKTTWVKLY